MAHNTMLEIRLSGENISPGKIRSKEIAEVIESVEDMIASMAIHEHSGLKKEDIVIGLKDIRQGSIGLIFAQNLAEITEPATRDLTKAISEKNFGALPSDVMKSLRKLSAFTRRNQCNTEIAIMNGGSKILTTLTPETEIPDQYPFSGETTLYGEIMRVGGSEPKIQFKTLENKIIYCKTNRIVAKKAGTKLYTQVGVHGVAEWNSETFEIENFKVTEISDYEPIPLSQAFEEIADLVGDSLDEIADVASFVSDLRQDYLEA